MKTPKIIAFIYPYSDLDRLKITQAFGLPTMNSISFFSPDNQVDFDVIVKKQQPTLILFFGEESKKLVTSSLHTTDIQTMECHHPSDKSKDANDLFGFGVQVGVWVSAWQVKENRI